MTAQQKIEDLQDQRAILLMDWEACDTAEREERRKIASFLYLKERKIRRSINRGNR